MAFKSTGFGSTGFGTTGGASLKTSMLQATTAQQQLLQEQQQKQQGQLVILPTQLLTQAMDALEVFKIYEQSLFSAYSAHFYNPRDNQFEQVTAQTYEQLKQRADFQDKEVKMASEIFQILIDRYMLVNQKQKQLNSQLVQLRQRQDMIKLGILQLANKDNFDQVEFTQFKQRIDQLDSRIYSFDGKPYLQHLALQAEEIAKVIINKGIV